MTAPKIRALQALADATDRHFLANAPLMAIVEAVQVLDAAGLLASGVANVPATDAARALREYPNASVAAEEAMRNGIEGALKQHDEGDLRDHLQLLLDRVEVTDAALAMCEMVDDAEKAKAVLDDEGFQGRTLEAQIRALVVAWSDERDEARRLRAGLPLPIDEETRARIMATLDCSPGSMQAVMHGVAALPWVDTVNHRVGPGRDSLIIGTCDGMGLDDLRRAEFRAALDTQRAAGVPIVVEVDGWMFTHPEVPLPCPDCCAADAGSHTSRCQAAEELADALLAPIPGLPPVTYTAEDLALFDQIPRLAPADVEAERVPCPKCGNPLTPTGMCLNFPECPDSVMPF